MLGQASFVSRKWTLPPHPPNIPSFQNANQEMYSLDSKFKHRVIIIMSVCQSTVLLDKVSIFPLQQSLGKEESPINESRIWNGVFGESAARVTYIIVQIMSAIVSDLPLPPSLPSLLPSPFLSSLPLPSHVAQV
jgi:hypothetical protein